jgi:hypothetical protein
MLRDQIVLTSFILTSVVIAHLLDEALLRAIGCSSPSFHSQDDAVRRGPRPGAEGWNRGEADTFNSQALRDREHSPDKGQQVYKLAVSDDRHSPSETPALDSRGVQFFCTFRRANDCGFREQSKVPGRAHLVDTARDGNTALRLFTQVGDSNVSGSGIHERNDLTTTQSQTDCYEGRTQWWAHSTLFPDDFIVPPSNGTHQWNVFFQFHQTSSTGQPNMVAEVVSSANGGLRFRIYGGYGNRAHIKLGPIRKNVWYDFVYHIRWSSESDGFFEAWINGRKVATVRGPTLYPGQGCYLKLSNYHSAMGQNNGVIHDRVIRGTTPQSVALTPLEGLSD